MNCPKCAKPVEDDRHTGDKFCPHCGWKDIKEGTK